MKHATLCLPIREDKILLGMKKTGFGKGKFNGFGGKVEEGESIEDAAIRELYEEAGIKTSKENIKKMAELKFTFPYATEKDWNQIVHVFLVHKWEELPKNSEEMDFRWFKREEIPFSKMWADDRHWLPIVLSEKKINASFSFDKDNETIKTKEIFELPE
jgi:8-oxo-dGTP pyrophosphatase MutT (NUDIX family)